MPWALCCVSYSLTDATFHAQPAGGSEREHSSYVCNKRQQIVRLVNQWVALYGPMLHADPVASSFLQVPGREGCSWAPGTAASSTPLLFTGFLQASEWGCPAEWPAKRTVAREEATAQVTLDSPWPIAPGPAESWPNPPNPCLLSMSLDASAVLMSTI